MKDSTVRSDIARRIILAAEDCSMPQDDLFRLSGVSARLFTKPPVPREGGFNPLNAGYLNMDMVFQMWDVVASQLDSDRALRSACRAVPLSKLGEFGFMCMTAPTVGHALRRIRWSFALLTDSGRWHMVTEGPRCKFIWDRVPRSLGQCLSNEALLAQFFDNISAFTGVRLPVLEVRLSHRELDSSHALARLADAPVHSEAGETSFTIPRDFLQQQPIHASFDLFDYFVAASRRLLQERSMQAGLALRVRHIVDACLVDASLSESNVAARLGLTPRTLQRQLARVGTSYKTERDNVLKERAKGLVMMTRRPLAEIATQLGFAEPSAFSHAYRRWFGVSPRTMRESLN